MFLKTNFICLLAVLGLCCYRAFSSCGEWGLLSKLPCAGFLLQWFLSWNMGSRACGLHELWPVGSEIVAVGSEVVARGLRSCGPWAQ